MAGMIWDELALTTAYVPSTPSEKNDKLTMTDGRYLVETLQLNSRRENPLDHVFLHCLPVENKQAYLSVSSISMLTFWAVFTRLRPECLAW